MKINYSASNNIFQMYISSTPADSLDLDEISIIKNLVEWVQNN